MFGLALPDMLMVFLTTSYAIVAFHAVNVGRIASMYRTLWASHRLRYLQLNIAQLVAWIGGFLIPIYFSPSSLLVSGMSVTSLCGCMSIYATSRRRSALVNAVLLALNLLLFYLLYLNVYRGWTYIVFCVSTLSVGLAMFAILRLSSDLQTGGLTSSQILAARTWLLWMIPLMYVIVDRQFASITPAVLRDTAVLGLMSLILPLYFLQRSIASLGPDKTGILIGFTPMVIVGFELIFLKSVQVPDVVGAVILPVIIVGFALYERSAKRRA